MNRGAFVAIIRDNTVLLVRSSTNPEHVDSWSLPGGVVERGETLKRGAKREAIEETGIVCSVGHMIVEADNIPGNIRVSIFKGSYIRGEIKIQEDEIAEAGWFGLKHALTLPLAYNTKSVLETL